MTRGSLSLVAFLGIAGHPVLAASAGKATAAPLLTRAPEEVCAAIVPTPLRKKLGIAQQTKAHINGSYHECLFDYGGATDRRIAVDIRCADPQFPVAGWTNSVMQE